MDEQQLNQKLYFLAKLGIYHADHLEEFITPLINVKRCYTIDHIVVENYRKSTRKKKQAICYCCRK